MSLFKLMHAVSQRPRLRQYSLDVSTYHRLADHALESLCESIDRIIESGTHASSASSGYDTSLAMGVLTVKLGMHGTFVLNKQPPNQQLWLSSPISGPKRYDYDDGRKQWIYKRDSTCLTSLLSKELSDIFKQPINLEIKQLK